MKSNLSYGRNILAMEDKELEVFVHRWVARQIKKYPDHHLFGNANDLGRDAVGFRSVLRHDGEWDNYQCKMLSKRVNDTMMHEEIGKILFHSSEGEFTPPAAYFFVAPKGFNRKAEKLLFSPNSFKQQMLDEWDVRCASRIRIGRPVVLTDALRTVIEAYPFENISGLDLPKILAMDDINLVLADAFGDDPGEAPSGAVPTYVAADEGYVQQLIGIYSESEGRTFADAAEVLSHSSHGPDLTMQRRRYFEADAFRRHFRDNIDPQHVEKFTEEILYGVSDVHSQTMGLLRLREVMTTAGLLPVSGIFGRHNRANVLVKQGTCHHLANDGVLPWKR